MNSGIYRLEKEYRFEAAHVLPNHAGKCSRLHGHSWVCRVVVEGSILCERGSETGMLIDYGKIDAAMRPLIEMYLDHYYLNESLMELCPRAAKNPTSEMIAKTIYDQLAQSLWDIKEVHIEETCTCRCVYRKESRRTDPD